MSVSAAQDVKEDWTRVYLRFLELRSGGSSYISFGSVCFTGSYDGTFRSAVYRSSGLIPVVEKADLMFCTVKAFSHACDRNSQKLAFDTPYLP